MIEHLGPRGDAWVANGNLALRRSHSCTRRTTRRADPGCARMSLACLKSVSATTLIHCGIPLEGSATARIRRRTELDAIQLSSLDDFESLEPDYLAKIAPSERSASSSMAHRCSVRAHEAGARAMARPRVPGQGPERRQGPSGHVRCAALWRISGPRGTLPIEAHIENTVKALKGVPVAGR